MVAKRSISKTSVLILIGVIHTATTTTVNAPRVNATTVNCTSSAYQNDRYCLKPGNGLKTWDEADKECRQKGGHLAVIRDEETQNAVANVTDSIGWSRVWIGGKLEYTWRWGSKFVQWNYTNWYLSSSEEEPDNPDNLNIQADDFEGCLSVGSGYDYGYKWINQECQLRRDMYYICEKPEDSSCQARNVYQRRCFIIHDTEKRNWYDANKCCHGAGGHLAYINSEEVQTTIERMLNDEGYYSSSSSFWIGGIYTADHWVWTTGEEIQNITLFYSHNNDLFCLEMWKRRDGNSYKWDSTECNIDLNYICQFDLPPTEHPSTTAMSTASKFTTGTFTAPDNLVTQETTLQTESSFPLRTNPLGNGHTTEISILAVLVGIEFIAIVILVVVLILHKRKSQRAPDLSNENTYSMEADNSLYCYATSDFGRTDDDKIRHKTVANPPDKIASPATSRYAEHMKNPESLTTDENQIVYKDAQNSDTNMYVIKDDDVDDNECVMTDNVIYDGSSLG